jgi:predicted permease
MAAVNQILILFIIMFIGVIAKRRNAINKDIEKSISSILTKIGLPALVLSSSAISYSSEILPNMISIFIITVISYAAVIAFGILNSKLFKLEKNTSNVFISLIVFPNAGFIGFPIASALYGEVGVFYASIANLVFSIIVWTYGILLYNSKEKLNFKSLASIGTITAILGIILFLFQIQIPAPILSALSLTGKMTTPLSMLLIGALIADVNLKALFSDWMVYWTCLIKLIVIPIITILILRLLNYNEMVISICTVMAALPSAAINAIFANEFNVNPAFASIGVFMTTLLCIVTLPLMLYIINILI